MAILETLISAGIMLGIGYYVVHKILPSGALDLSNLQFPALPVPGAGGGGGGGQIPNPMSISNATNPNIPGTAFTFNVVGDIDYHKPTGDNLCGDNPTLAIIYGDFSYDCNAQKWWKGTMAACNGKRVIASVGNHDCGGKGFIDLFPLNRGKWEFIYKVGNIAFIAVNTGTCNARCSNPSTSENLFKQAQADPSVKFIIVHQHKPHFTTGVSPDAPMSYHHMYRKYPKVRLVFAGHNHTYKRYIPQDGILYVTAGQGGHAGNNSDNSKGPSTGRIGVVKCRAGRDGSIVCQYVASSNGEILDQFGISPQGRPIGSGGVKPAQSASSNFVQSFNTNVNVGSFPATAIKEDMDNEVIARMDAENARIPKRKYNKPIYHYSVLK